MLQRNNPGSVDKIERHLIVLYVILPYQCRISTTTIKNENLNEVVIHCIAGNISISFHFHLFKDP
jgi:hypothetical protein